MPSMPFMMVRPSLALAAAAVSFSVLVTPSASTAFLRSGVVTAKDAELSLAAELASSVGSDRLSELEAALRLTYSTLPKNADGLLGHQAVRYVLHRMFVQRYGWYIKGLEPGGDTWQTTSTAASVKEWVPSFLQARLEQRLGGRGLDLHELAALAAALEDLVRKEAVGRLSAAYEVFGLPTEVPVTESKAKDLIGTYMMVYLLGGNFSASTRFEAEQKMRRFAARYTGWAEAEEWLQAVEARHLNASRDGLVDFDTTSRVADDIGREYGSFNDLECRSLKGALLELQGRSRKAGRVRLPDFYKKSLFSHWRFTEKVEYLRVLGALDESDPKQPLVIVPNYLGSRPNCLEATNLYAVCCRNECEDLLGHLEQQLQAPTAAPERIAELVAALPSDTVAAPRNLSSSLLQRLQQMADMTNGQVNLHGRLFAQWMHHAYPHECPYPHEAGTTNPQTPDEWMKENGLDSSSSEEEMRMHVERDTCPAVGPCFSEDEDAELPWSEAEELLVVPSTLPEGSTAQSHSLAWRVVLIAPFLLTLTGVMLMLMSKRTHTADEPFASADLRRTILIVLACTLVAAAFAVDLLDKTVFICALVGGLGALLPKCSKRWSSSSCSSCLPKLEKCSV